MSRPDHLLMCVMMLAPALAAQNVVSMYIADYSNPQPLVGKVIGSNAEADTQTYAVTCAESVTSCQIPSPGLTVIQGPSTYAMIRSQSENTFIGACTLGPEIATCSVNTGDGWGPTTTDSIISHPVTMTATEASGPTSNPEATSEPEVEGQPVAKASPAPTSSPCASDTPIPTATSTWTNKYPPQAYEPVIIGGGLPARDIAEKSTRTNIYPPEAYEPATVGGALSARDEPQPTTTKPTYYGFPKGAGYAWLTGGMETFPNYAKPTVGGYGIPARDLDHAARNVPNPATRKYGLPVVVPTSGEYAAPARDLGSAVQARAAAPAVVHDDEEGEDYENVAVRAGKGVFGVAGLVAVGIAAVVVVL